jgi:thioredoxin 1
MAEKDQDTQMNTPHNSNIIELTSQKELNGCTSQGIALIVFGAPWCHPCQIQWPFLYEAAARSNRPVVLAQVDAEEHETLASAYRIEGLPTILLFHHGVLFRRFVGVQTTDELLAAIEQANLKTETQ